MRWPIFLGILLSAPSLFAQNGPRIGLGLATQSAGGLFQNTSDLLGGPIIGWHFEAPLHPKLSIMPEVLWMTKGAVVRNPAMATRSRATFRYLEVPILVKVMTDQAGDGLYLLAGPTVGYFLSGRYQVWQSGDEIIDSKYNTDSNPNLRRIEFSGLVGMGFQGNRWAFDVRAQSSITPFERFVRIQNIVYGITLAYRIKKDAGSTEE